MSIEHIVGFVIGFGTGTLVTIVCMYERVWKRGGTR